ncbi:hypothetical protein OOK27_05215 [Streptomyces canus]|uniref:hypothetical protein n=1 Tax=Streptomyces canus TaxID=58343 RepID=UPI002251E613|nr:hypothetical protein [Streptomyces canus]MCX5253572.1 hypothetical protein [Streptomyces canus]
MTTTPPLDLDEIAARAEAATRGPWGFYDGDNYAEVAADMQVTSPGSCNYRERVARLEDEDYWDDQEHDGDDEERAPEQMAANAAFIAHAREDVPALLAEVRRLRATNEQLDRALSETIDDRDQAHETLDKLAYAVAPIEVIGEHSSMNCPWTNALDLITPAAEVDKLRAELAASRAQAWRDLADRANPAHEASWFGDFGHMVGDWIRDQADHEARPAAVAAAGDTDEANA